MSNSVEDMISGMIADAEKEALSPIAVEDIVGRALSNCSSEIEQGVTDVYVDTILQDVTGETMLF